MLLKMKVNKNYYSSGIFFFSKHWGLQFCCGKRNLSLSRDKEQMPQVQKRKHVFLRKISEKLQKVQSGDSRTPFPINMFRARQHFSIA